MRNQNESGEVHPEDFVAKPETARETVDLSPNEDEKHIPEKTPENREKRLQEEQQELKHAREKLADRPDQESLIDQVRFSQQYPTRPVVLSAEQQKFVATEVSRSEASLKGNYEPGFGISPCSDPKELFYDQVWSRDGAHAVGNYFAQVNPKAVRESLETTFRNQKEDGQLPLRVQRVYVPVRMVPGIGVWLSENLFKLRGKNKDGRLEVGIYKGQHISGGEDSVPATIIATGELFLNSEEGKEFAAEHYDQLKKAIEHFRTKIDEEDGLADLDKSPDWAETINRKGKLGTVNTWWARSLRLMEFMAKQLGHEEDAAQYKQEFRKTKESVLEKLYDKEGAYFRTSAGEDRVDTVASIFGALYLVDAKEAARIEETLTARVKHSSGLVNFDPPYPPEQVNLFVRTFGNGHYHNENVWPWVTCENIQVKIKIALQHPEEEVRERYKKEAVEDLADASKLFNEAGGAYEVMQADKPEPALGRRLGITTYKPPKNLMGSLAAYQGAYRQLNKLGWI